MSRIEIATEKMRHNLEVYERLVKNGFKPVGYPTTALVMNNGNKTLTYSVNQGEIRRMV